MILEKDLLSVVAEEIRTLAEQTANFTKQIDETVRIIQRETFQAAEEMEKVNEAVKDGVVNIRSLEKLFSTLKQSMDKINIYIGEITSSSNQISAVTEQVSISANKTASLANKTNDQAQNISDASEKQWGLLKEIEGVLKGLEEYSDRLHRLIGTFKV